MYTFLVYGRRLAEWLCLWVIGHGIIQFLATHEIYPDRFVASMITDAAEAPIWADWIISGAFGLLIMFILEIFFWNRHSSSVRRRSNTNHVAVALDRATTEMSATISPPPNTAHNALSIEFSRDDLHEIVQTFPAGTIRRRLKISVLNRGNGWLSNCRLLVEQTVPSIYDNAIELLSGFTLQIGERRYSEFLYFDERFPDGHAAPKVLLAHQSGAWSYVEIGFSTTHTTIFTLKATSGEARECTAFFRAFVENGRLRMEKL